MPISPLQILWVNMVTAVTLALALAFEPSEEDIMRRQPRSPEAPIISRHLMWRIAFVSILIAAVAVVHFLVRQRAGVSLEQARTVAVNTLVAAQLFYLLNSRFILGSALHLRTLRGNRAVYITAGVLVLLQLGFTYLGPAQALFGTAAMTAFEWSWAIAAGLAVFLLVELEKAILRRWDAR
jgi:magnesium-transporting ATPase (P-type)